MATATMLGGPDDGNDAIKVEPGQASILIYWDGAHWRCPIRKGRNQCSERKKES